jgi:hypothetical protein
MEGHERVRRPEPERTQPIRNWWSAFGPPGMPPFPGMPQPPGNEPAAADAVSRGVELGYQVVGEYLRQGQNVARMMWAPYLGGPAAGGTNARMEPLVRSFMDFASVWMELMGMTGGGGFPSPVGMAGPFHVGRPPEPTPEAPPPAPAVRQSPAPSASGTVEPEARAAPSPILTLDLESARRVEVSVDLRPRASGASLRVVDLRGVEPGLPPLTDVSLTSNPEEGRVILRLRVPDASPPGIYTGVILDLRTGLPCGTLAVRLVPR